MDGSSMDGARQGFEGSFLGDADKISPRAILECKICWTPYDPAEGDETRAIPPGTAFLDLPEDWKCPECDAPKAQFMVVEDSGRAEQAEAQRLADAMADAVRRLTAEFHEIHQAKMRDVPFSNKALHVEPVGFRVWEGRFLGVLVAPWFMNLTLLPGPEDDWSALKPGEKERIAFPSGAYEFLHNVRPMAGGYKGCSLFSPMHEFDTQAAAVAVAGAVMPALFDPANRDEGARADEIRESRETEIAAAEAAAAAPNPEPTRRGVMGAAPREDGDA